MLWNLQQNWSSWLWYKLKVSQRSPVKEKKKFWIKYQKLEETPINSERKSNLELDCEGKNDIDPYCGEWNIHILLSERGQATKATYCVMPCMWNIQNRKIWRDWKTVLARGWWGRMERDCQRVQGFFLGDGLIFKVGCSDDCTTLYIYWNPWIICFKWVNFMVWKLYLKKAV